MPTPPTRIELARQRRIARERFRVARIAERAYASNLAAIGRHVGDIVKGFAHKGFVEDFEQMKRALEDYGRGLTPWATAVTNRMSLDVDRREWNAWKQLSRSVGSALHKELEKFPTGEIRRRLMAEQVSLITSLPREAADRVHQLTASALITGQRADVVAKEILLSGHVTAGRARLIARTEVARTASVLTQSRSEFIGSDSYIWRTVGDTDVRNRDGDPVGSHRKLEGKVIYWDDPPVASTNGKTAHAGQIYNCRCWPEPILPDHY